MLIRNLAACGALALAFTTLSTAQTTPSEPFQQYTQTNLVSNVPGKAAFTDPNLVNAWGLARASNGPWWVADNGLGISTLYDGTGKANSLVVTIPPSNPNISSTGSPTGMIFNGTQGFTVAHSKPAIFLFATEDGTLAGWNPGVNLHNALTVRNEGQASVFKGITMGQTTVNGVLEDLLYVADFRHGQVSVYDARFQHVPTVEAAIAKTVLPHGYAPFNVQNLGGNIYVAFAKQDAAKHDEVDGAGLGFVIVCQPSGQLIKVLQSGPWMNAPWGMAVASSDFGAYSHDILVGNFGSGEITVFDPITGYFKGTLRDSKSNPIVIPGLWGISFGNGGGAGSATSLYFGSGPNHEQDGLFGSLTAIQNPAGNDN